MGTMKQSRVWSSQPTRGRGAGECPLTRWAGTSPGIPPVGIPLPRPSRPRGNPSTRELSRVEQLPPSCGQVAGGSPRERRWLSRVPANHPAGGPPAARRPAAPEPSEGGPRRHPLSAPPFGTSNWQESGNVSGHLPLAQAALSCEEEHWQR